MKTWKLYNCCLLNRAYQHSAEQRRLRTLLLEWHTVTSCSLSEAVQHFALELGLQPQEKPAVGSGELNSFDDGKDTEGHNTNESVLMSIGSLCFSCVLCITNLYDINLNCEK